MDILNAVKEKEVFNINIKVLKTKALVEVFDRSDANRLLKSDDFKEAKNEMAISVNLLGLKMTTSADEVKTKIFSILKDVDKVEKLKISSKSSFFQIFVFHFHFVSILSIKPNR